MDRDNLPNNESEGVWIIALAWQSTVALIPFLLVGLIYMNRFGILVAVVSSLPVSVWHCQKCQSTDL